MALLEAQEVRVKTSGLEARAKKTTWPLPDEPLAGAPAAPARGKCSRCSRKFRLRKDGTLQGHWPFGGSDDARYCFDAGLPPAQDPQMDIEECIANAKARVS